jgi:hypothetical protein
MSPDLAADLRTLHEVRKVAVSDNGKESWDFVRTVLDMGGPDYLNRIVAAGSPPMLGCLLALLREASGDPRAFVYPLSLHPEGVQPGEHVREWRAQAWANGNRLFSVPGPTEADALVAAIHALAEECRHAAR